MDKTEIIRMRVTPDQKEKLKSAAASVGLSLSAYVLFRLGVSAGEALGDLILKKNE